MTKILEDTRRLLAVIDIQCSSFMVWIRIIHVLYMRDKNNINFVYYVHHGVQVEDWLRGGHTCVL